MIQGPRGAPEPGAMEVFEVTPKTILFDIGNIAALLSIVNLFLSHSPGYQPRPRVRRAQTAQESIWMPWTTIPPSLGTIGLQCYLNFRLVIFWRLPGAAAIVPRWPRAVLG